MSNPQSSVASHTWLSVADPFQPVYLKMNIRSNEHTNRQFYNKNPFWFWYVPHSFAAGAYSIWVPFMALRVCWKKGHRFWLWSIVCEVGVIGIRKGDICCIKWCWQKYIFEIVSLECWKCLPVCQMVSPVTDIYKKIENCSSIWKIPIWLSGLSILEAP